MDIKEIEFEHPWQVTPTKLIQYGLGFLKGRGDFDRQVAYLLLDVGVENLFKVYLSLDKEITQTPIKYHKRQKAISGSFYKLVETVKESTEDKVERALFERVKYFHKIRNKLYHQGNGVLPSKYNLKEYGEIAEKLLFELLEVNLSPSIDIGEHIEKISQQLAEARYADDVKTHLDELRLDLTGLIGQIKPEWVKRSFVNRIHSIWEEYPDDVDDDPRIWELNKEERDPRFNELLGQDIEDSWLIKESTQDICFLYLALFQQREDEVKYEELENYVSARMFSKTGPNSVHIMCDRNYQWRGEEYEGERKEIRNELIHWIKSVQLRIEDLLEQSISET